MAPMTRRSQNSASGAKRAPTRKRPTRQQSQPEDEWVQDDVPSQNGDLVLMEEDDDEEPQLSIEAPLVSMRDAINPLREMADKIGKEVERFAITMDVFLDNLSQHKNKFKAVQSVVSDFRKIAQDSVNERKHGHEKELSRQLRDEWTKQAQLSTALGTSATKPPLALKSGALLGMKMEKIKELRDWQQELDIWDLFQIILEVHYRPQFDPDKLREEVEMKLKELDTPNRFTSEDELWQRFVLEDNVAKERTLVKKWLEQAVDHQQSDVSDIVQELESKAGIGKGVWSQGWMHTRERIKGEKRLRSWPSASDSIQPQIRSSDNNELLITQLDPDAPSKHQRALEKVDAIAERAMWMACWEMLRRGQSWEDVQEWCNARNEGWRAFAMGRAGDSSTASSSVAWRKMCHLASQSASADEYEAAAFGLLGGSVQPVQKIARSVDDHLYAYYNGLLLRQYDQYVQRVSPNKTASANARFLDDILQNPVQAQEDITKLIRRLRDSASTSIESTQPLKIIQSYLLANELDALIHTVGVAVSAEDHRSGAEERMILWLKEGDDFAQPLVETEIALDPRALRITAHISMLLSTLRTEAMGADEITAEENVMISFIQQLRAAGKRDLIPLYAAQLSQGRRIVFLSDFLLDISQPAEQEELLSLMIKTYGFPVHEILWEQLTWLTEHMTTKPGKAVEILERYTDQKEYPGQRIKLDFLPEALTEEDVKIVRSLQWFLLLPGQWELTFQAMSTALRKCLMSGRFSCALEIIRNFPYETISVHKSYEILGRSVNLMDESLSWPRKEQETEQWLVLQKQSNAYFELAQLVQAIEALSRWAKEERPYVSRSPPPSPLPAEIKEAKRDVDEAMQPLLDGLLTKAETPEEAKDFEFIRQAYLPEILIAYNTVLHTAGNIYTRDCLLESMDLSVKIAEESNGLAELLVRAGRMKEAVESFAYSSKAILLLKAQSNKPWKTKKDREGKDPSIWDIGPQGRSSPAVRDGVVPA